MVDALKASEALWPSVSYARRPAIGRSATAADPMPAWGDPWTRNALALLASYPDAATLEATLREVYGFAREHGWFGACHAGSAVTHVLLREQGIDSDLCLGEVGRAQVVFDHSWLEIGGRPCDVAIAFPLVPSYRRPPTVGGRDLDTMGEPHYSYGIASGLPRDEGAASVRSMSFARFMDGAPYPLGLWTIAGLVAERLKMDAAPAFLQAMHSDCRWTRRPHS